MNGVMRRERMVRWTGLWVLALFAAACSDDVTAPEPELFDLELSTLSVGIASIGATGSIDVQVRDRMGKILENSPLTWSVADASVAEHLGNGVFKGLKNGETDVTVAPQGQPTQALTFKVTVRQVPVSLRVMLPQVSLRAVGDFVELPIVARDALGVAVPIAQLGVQSRNEQVARVDALGRAIAVGPGETLLFVFFQGREYSVRADVQVKVTRRFCLLTQLGAIVGPEFCAVTEGTVIRKP